MHFFFPCVLTKGGGGGPSCSSQRPWKPGIRIMWCGCQHIKIFQSAMHVLWRWRCRAFPEQVSPWILSLESINYFRTSEYFSHQKKKKNCYEEILVGRQTDRGVVNSHCMQISLVMNMRFFWQWLKWCSMFITFLSIGNDVISLESRLLRLHIFIHCILNQFRYKLSKMM